MIVCVIMAISRLLRNTIPDWHSGIIAGVMLLIVLDRLFLHQRLKSLPVFSPEWALTFGTQWIVFILFIRLLLSYAKGLDAFVIDLAFFTQGDLAHFFSPEYIVTLLLAILAWYLPASFLELLDEIGLSQILVLGEDPGLVQSDAVSAHQRLVNLIFSLGIVLVILTALARIDLRATLSSGSFIADPNRFSAGEAGVLLYFILGLALLAQARLMSLQTGWNVQRIPVSSDNLARQWALYSLIFLFIIVVAVSLLPTGDSLGIFSVLGTLFYFLWGILYFLWQLIISILFILFSLPFLLFGKDTPLTSELPETPVLPPEPMQPLLTTESSAIWILIRSILLWGALLVIIVFSLRQFIRQHDDLTTALRRVPVIGWLILAWQWLRRNAKKTRAGLSRAIADGWQSIVARLEGKRVLPRGKWLSLRSLDPRRRIYFFYLAMIRRGGEQGLTRKPSQTPSEYAVTLEKSLLSGDEDIDLITEAFIEARYSRREVDSRKADIVKRTWGRIRRALQNKSKSGLSEKK
jgi:hypothetical protein